MLTSRDSSMSQVEVETKKRHLIAVSLPVIGPVRPWGLFTEMGKTVPVTGSAYTGVVGFRAQGQGWEMCSL